MNPVILVRWYYLDWYSGWQAYNEASVVFSLFEKAYLTYTAYFTLSNG